MVAVRCRFIQPVGHQGEYVVMWPRYSRDSDCPSGTIHSTRRSLPDWDADTPPALLDENGEYTDEAWGWEGACERCGAPIPWDAEEDVEWRPRVGSASRVVFDTEDGKVHPGDMYFSTHPADRWCTWSNCDGRHLHVVLPNGHDWDVDSRASNCTKREDKIHRCWVRIGDPPQVSVSKDGLSCAAGAGSILSGDWHGFLRDGALVQ